MTTKKAAKKAAKSATLTPEQSATRDGMGEIIRAVVHDMAPDTSVVLTVVPIPGETTKADTQDKKDVAYLKLLGEALNKRTVTTQRVYIQHIGLAGEKPFPVKDGRILLTKGRQVCHYDLFHRRATTMAVNKLIRKQVGRPRWSTDTQNEQAIGEPLLLGTGNDDERG